MRLNPFRAAPAAEAWLAAAVVAIITLMIVPLPPQLLDILLVGNLALSVTILLVTLYVRDALQVSSFPTLLLLATLLRLSLNVSSTRLILLHAEAGQVIRAFGQFVVSGNYVVGAVVFLILVIIQFVVIAKGSERVAEVAARFTLDAMPGKQMAIDADLRSGTIDAERARTQRQALNRESQFYGAMDGAMKFVKGDVVASFLITLINLSAGLVIGVAQRDMGALEAAQRFGLLTIGDGLVAQIPALIVAISAGLLVTRVASASGQAPLAQSLAAELRSAPRASSTAGLFIAGLAFVPGLPAWPFLLVGGTVLALSWRHLASEPALSVHPGAPSSGQGSSGREVTDEVRLPATWSLTCSAELVRPADRAQPADSTLDCEEAARWARSEVFRTLGVMLPPCCIDQRRSLPLNEFVLSVREVPTKRILLDLSPTSPEATRALGKRLVEELRARASDFVGLSETQALLDTVSRVAPASVQQVVPTLVSLPTLTEILRRLVEERVSVRDMASVLEALAQVAHAEKDASLLAEHIRCWLRRAITYDVTGGTGILLPLTLEYSIEEAIRDALSETALGSYLTLAPAACRDIVEALQRVLQDAPQSVRDKPVLLTAPDIRRFVRKLLKADLPEARVVTFAELLPETSIQSVGEARLAMD